MDIAEVATAAPTPALQSEEVSPLEDQEQPTIEITIKFPPEQHNHTWTFSPEDTFEDLIFALSIQFPGYDWSKAKALPEKRPKASSRAASGAPLKPIYTPAADANFPLSALHQTTIRFMAPATQALNILQAQREAAMLWRSRRQRALAHQRRHAVQPKHVPTSSLRGGFSSSSDEEYTFQSIRPLPHLPNADHARSILQRLASDPGIRTVMRQHRFRVGLLTEMDPAANTSASRDGSSVTRILGLNRNKGQVIELRLRTDAYDGWRDYKGVRRTLCHELTHNVYSEHDSKFWALCKELEREVEKADYWGNAGRTVGGEEYYQPPPRGDEERNDEEDGEVQDHGGWIGGTFVLGGNPESNNESSSNEARGGGGEGVVLSERERRALAAERRLRAATKQAERQGSGGDGDGASNSQDQGK
ncbi:hypothetical protein VTJ04DRAFT_9400 [Mycothermus thermophilus]|uniref:uncharacterized protein n=1 Tax=Humicola insolens TaxID=85995 RepID=UPI003742E37F